MAKDIEDRIMNLEDIRAMTPPNVKKFKTWEEENLYNMVQNQKAIIRIWKRTTQRMMCYCIFITTVYALTTILLVGLAKADTKLYLGQLSNHHGESGVKREDHGLIILEHNKIMVGWWRNSLNKDAYALGYRTSALDGDLGNFLRNTALDFLPKGVDAGVKFGGATGYPSPVYAALYAQYKFIDINFVPDVVTSIGFVYNF